jgi:type II restriction/modification system DNA methylase subunit YeeA
MNNGTKFYEGNFAPATQLEQITNNGEIKGFKPVTQIEYDALTTEQKEDGTVYLIEEA